MKEMGNKEAEMQKMINITSLVQQNTGQTGMTRIKLRLIEIICWLL